MSYSKNTWVNGDVITAAKMNNIENGIAAAGDSAYDAVISYYHDGNSSHDPVFTIISGTYASLKEKIMNHIPPVILVRAWLEGLGTYTATTATSLYIFPTTEYPNATLAFSCKIPTSYGGETYSSGWVRITLQWTSNDELSIY